MNAPTVTAGLAARNLGVGYGARSVLASVNLSIAPGGVTALVGPNGSGKSTLLKTMARLIAPQAGTVLLDGQAIASLPTREVARRLAILPQAPAAPSGITVLELVEQGRFPHVGALRMLTRQDRDEVQEALALTGMERFAQRPLETLSGGERQRAWIALALAQATPWLLLDEPTTFLDIGHQFEVLDLVSRLNAERGLSIVMVLHDLNQAARFASRMIVLKDGAVHADGPPAAVMTPTMLAQVFAMEARIVPDPETGTPFMMPIRHLPARSTTHASPGDADRPVPAVAAPC